ncbi:hypothetical protein SAMN02745673_04130 [Marinactinospora thermotolerans DSM 45154]|uniref:Uncharacterized protein n=1 Tax=Marinactinospora thermotolerans DSM 45154 TaxID=1122192 RepID=A0A1T4SXW0_9ACTN|nr:hypothetical protein [Marinactinospora thermotolerans]SKA33036.1 hypothetical protein SAMN02745673_04130 [Marinactinospora thermotolerans DSM 45154]
MSKPSFASRFSGAVKRLFGKSTRPVVSSKPEDLKAGDAAVQDSSSETNEALPADTSSSVAEEFTTEAVNSSESPVTTGYVGSTPTPLSDRAEAEKPSAGEEPSRADASAKPPAGDAGDRAEEPAVSAAEDAPAAQGDAARPREDEKDEKPEPPGDDPAGGPRPGPGAALVTAPADEPSAPAAPTAEGPSAAEGAAIARELDVAEAPTQAADARLLAEIRAGGPEPAEELPVPGYDGLTLPSIRARLRRLTIDEVRRLRVYESANAARPEFLRMYDNRIAKLEAEATAE